MARLYLVRHGDTELNSAERYWGRSDVKLSAGGIGQAERLGQVLARERIYAIYSSDLQRARVTAEIIAAPHKLAVTTCPELREVDFGDLEGLNFAEITRGYPELARSWVEWAIDLRFPGGERVAEFSQRVNGFLERLKKHTPGEGVAVVAHSGVIRLLMCHLLGIELRFWRQFRLDLASLTILDTCDQGAVICLLNDVCHLR